MSPQPGATNLQPNFDSIARPYRWLEYVTFGRLLERCRFAQLAHLQRSDMPGVASALVLGDGDGRFLARLVAQHPSLRADVIDLSPTMLALSRARVPPTADLHFQTADIRNYAPPPGQTYDLIATHFFLDCLTEQEIAQLIDRLHPSFSGETTWVISEFAVPACGHAFALAPPIARLLIRTLYWAFRILTGLRVQRLPCYAPLLAQAGFGCENTQLFLGGILRSECWRHVPGPQATASPSRGSQ